MAAASAYILIVPADRREILLAERASSSFRTVWDAVEPVETFDHPRSVPLLVLASFENGYITHIADARKGMSAGTGLARLNMRSLDALSKPIAFEVLEERISSRSRTILKTRLQEGGLLPPGTLKEVVRVLEELDPAIATRLGRLSEGRARRIAALSANEKQNLALQKEAVTTALEVAEINADQVVDWTPNVDQPTSFLQGLPQARVREDVMISADFNTLPGFEVFSEFPHIAAKTFRDEDDHSKRITIITANRLPLEQQTGADLIYFHEGFKSFVLVQYKALEKRGDIYEFRWNPTNPKDQFVDELRRMDEMIVELEKADPDNEPDGFRFSSNPFFLKFCPRIVFNPDDKRMFKGLYLPHGLWKLLAASDRLKGSSGGHVLTYDNVGRRLSNPDFLVMLRGAWVGTTINQSVALKDLIRQIVESGRTVTFAVNQSALPVPVPLSEPVEDGPLEDEEEGLIAISEE